MTKDEMKNKISMALKDPTLQQGFEIICKENAELENDYKLIDKSREHLVQEKYNLEYKIENLENKIEHHQEVINTLQKKNAELSEKLNRHKHDCPNCSAFGKHCPHRVNGDPYTYDCYLTVADLEKENAELKEYNKYLRRQRQGGIQKQYNKVAIIKQQDDQLTKAKEIIEKVAKMYRYSPRVDEIIEQAEQFLSEVEK